VTGAPPPGPNDAPPIDELRELAESAARVGGDLARQSFGTTQSVRLKEDRSEVTDVDLATEHAIIAHIRSSHPNDTFIGEETAPKPHTRQRRGGVSSGTHGKRQSSFVNPQSTCWVIDPIDGTRNYVRNIPIFVCSVAAMRDGAPVAGAIYDPVQKTMYSAARGRGVLVDGEPFMPDHARFDKLYGRRAKLLVGIPSARRPTTQRFVLYAVQRHVVRNLGSAALHLALAACGQLDAVVSGNCRLWDVAAGCLLISEAGGVVTSPDGTPLFPIDLSHYAGTELPFVAGRAKAHATLLRGAPDA
jgi:myo-inositol-1(or 4)-monophosphatase